MRAAGAPLMLLLCLSLTRGDAQGDADSPQRVQVDVWAELRALRDMVVEQRAQLQTERQCHQTTVEELKKERAALEAKVSATDRRLELLEGEHIAMSIRLTSSESQAEQLSTRLTSSESWAEAAEKASAGRPKVAFSASLGSAMGPVAADTVIVYDRVLTNVGQAYSASSGAFTAPVKGVYRVGFTGADSRPKAWLSVHLFKNGQRVMLRGSYNNGGENGGDNKYVSLSLVLELEVGDVVDTRISRTHRLIGDQNKPTTFDGFLVFPL